MKRIFFITTTTKREGPGNQLGVLIEHLDRSRFEPTVVTVLGGGEWDARYRELGVKRIDLGMRKPFDLLAPLRLLTLLRRERPDLVQTQMLRADIYGRWACGLLGIPYITVVQNMDVWKRTGAPFDRYATWFDARQLKRARRIVAVSNAVADDLVERQGIPRDLIEVIYNSAKVERFAEPTTADERRAWRQTEDIPDDALVVTDTGRFTVQKAPEVWAAAAAMVLRDRPATHFVRANDGPLLEQTVELAERLGITSNVHFVGERGDIREMLYASDVFVLPSRFEGMPTVLVESLAAGRATVATDVSGNPEIVADRETGLLVPSDNPRALADAIVELLDDAALRAKLGAAGQASVAGRFDIRTTSQAYQALYQRLLS